MTRRFRASAAAPDAGSFRMTLKLPAAVQAAGTTIVAIDDPDDDGGATINVEISTAGPPAAQALKLKWLG